MTYPPRSLEPGWEPDPLRYSTRLDDDDDVFRWPRNRLCLTPGTAKRRADLFRKYGAEVTIEPSNPVTWPDPAGAR